MIYQFLGFYASILFLFSAYSSRPKLQKIIYFATALNFVFLFLSLFIWPQACSAVIMGDAYFVFITSFILIALQLPQQEQAIFQSTPFKYILYLILFVIQILVADLLLKKNILWNSHTYDATLRHYDLIFGFDPSLFWASVLNNSYPMELFFKIMYGSLSVAIAAACLLGSSQKILNFIFKCIVATFIGWCFYNLFPACGPRYFMPNLWVPHFPNLVMTLSDAPRNCIPSLHCAICFFIWWHIKQAAFNWRCFMAIWLMAILVSTIAIGEHYMADLLLGAIFAYLFDWLWQRFDIIQIFANTFRWCYNYTNRFLKYR